MYSWYPIETNAVLLRFEGIRFAYDRSISTAGKRFWPVLGVLQFFWWDIVSRAVLKLPLLHYYHCCTVVYRATVECAVLCTPGDHSHAFRLINLRYYHYTALNDLIAQLLSQYAAAVQQIYRALRSSGDTLSTSCPERKRGISCTLRTASGCLGTSTHFTPFASRPDHT